MQVNSAYLNNHIPEVVDNNVPLLITSCGNYRMKSREMFETKRDKGRKDYQLLYIASGRAHFFIDGKENIVTAGNIVIFYPNEPQYYRYYKKEHTSVYWIHFTGSYVEDILTHYNISKNEHIIYIGTSPDLQLVSANINDGVVLKVTCTTKPEVTIENYKGILADKPSDEVTDADVDAQLEQMQKRNARMISVDDRPAQLNDQVVIDFEGFQDGVAFEGGKAENFELGLGSHQFSISVSLFTSF